MKRILFPILVLVLALGLALPMAGTVGAVTPPLDRTAAITAAADRLAEQQNTGDGYDEGYIGGWRMLISETPPGTYLRTHNIGVTAIGILKAHELQDKVAYETALAKAYKFVVDHEPGWIQDPNDSTKWKESPGGVNSWPDIHFLIGLAESAESDSSLLTAIQGEVPGTTADDIAALAKARWDDRLNHAGAVYPSEVGTATGMADWLVYVRVPNWASLIPWDLEPAVKSALALHEKYPGDGYLAQAQDIAEAIYDCIYGDPSYLDINDPTEKCYTLGLAGAIEAFTEAGLYPDEASQLKDLLIAYQNEVGFWDANDRTDEDAGTQCVQETAYAVMALIAQGDADARTAAIKGCSWLVNTQDVLGGWDPSSFESGDENLECDGEAAWALATAEAPVTIDGKGYYSIQSAINAALPSDIITCAAGTYDPFTVIGKTGLTIQSGSVVTVQGLQVVATNYGDRDAVVFVSDSTNIVLDEVIIGPNTGKTQVKDYGVIYENSSGEINNCTVSPNTSGDMNSIAIGIWDSSDVTIDLCTIEYFGRLGVFIYNGCTVDIIGGSIEGQVYSGEGEVCYGVEIEGAYMDATPGTGSHVTLDGVEIFNCDNTFGTGPSWASGGVYINGWMEYFDADDSTVIVENCDIHDNYVGIISVKSSLSSAHYNSIYDNRDCGVDSIAAHDTSTAVFDAENNWWGHASGPSGEYGRTNPTGKVIGKGDAVGDNVDWDPWLSHPINLTPHVPVPPGPP